MMRARLAGAAPFTTRRSWRVHVLVPREEQRDETVVLIVRDAGELEHVPRDLDPHRAGVPRAPPEPVPHRGDEGGQAPGPEHGHHQGAECLDVEATGVLGHRGTGWHPGEDFQGPDLVELLAELTVQQVEACVIGPALVELHLNRRVHRLTSRRRNPDSTIVRGCDRGWPGLERWPAATRSQSTGSFPWRNAGSSVMLGGAPHRAATRSM